MPREVHTAEEKQADKDALAAGKCPECGADLLGAPLGEDGDLAQYIRNHAATEFPQGGSGDVKGSDYQRRYDSLMSLAADVASGKTKPQGAAANAKSTEAKK